MAHRSRWSPPQPRVTLTPGYDAPMALLLAALLLVSPAPAAEAVLTIGHDGRVVQSSVATPISLDLVDADIRSVLRLFADHADLNFVLDDSIKGTVTVTMKDVPWDQALAAILMTKGLVAVPMVPEGEPASVFVVQPLGG